MAISDSCIYANLKQASFKYMRFYLNQRILDFFVILECLCQSILVIGIMPLIPILWYTSLEWTLDCHLFEEYETAMQTFFSLGHQLVLEYFIY